MEEDDDRDKLLEEIEELKNKIKELEEHLKLYTAPTRSKKYYQAHREEIIAKVKENKPSDEKKREYNRKYYEKEKKKLKEEK